MKKNGIGGSDNNQAYQGPDPATVPENKPGSNGLRYNNVRVIAHGSKKVAK